MTGKPIQIWANWASAPQEFKRLSSGNQGGIILVPAGLPLPMWLEEIWSGTFMPEQEIMLPDGDLLIIWSSS